MFQLDRCGFCQKICCKVCAHRSRHLGDQYTNPPFIRSAYESLQMYHTLHNEMSHLSFFQISDAFTRLLILQARFKYEWKKKLQLRKSFIFYHTKERYRVKKESMSI